MKLTKLAINRINDAKVIAELMKALGFSEQWVRRLAAQNKMNGPLTTYRALEVIRRETGLEDSKILESPKLKKVAKSDTRIA
jgi:hypothetical protein